MLETGKDMDGSTKLTYFTDVCIVRGTKDMDPAKSRNFTDVCMVRGKFVPPTYKRL